VDWLFDWTWTELLWGLVIFLVTFVGSLGLVALIVVMLPATYFCAHHTAAFAWADRHPVWRWAALVGKNFLGCILVLLGIVMSLPGVPGQGILTILIGLMLMDFPGKLQMERKLVSRPAVHGSINRLRQRFGKPPLVLDDLACFAQGSDTKR
jgi:hypothetical protein